MNVRTSTLFIALFLLPLLAAAIFTQFGFAVSARDDQNYLNELETRDLYDLSPDPVSWSFLALFMLITGVSEQGLRWAGFVVAACTVLVLLRQVKDRKVIQWFVISMLPVYLNVYFSQIRLAIALFLFVLVVTSRLNKLLAPPLAALGHTSFAVLIFPPAVIILPLVLQAGTIFDPDSTAALKLLAYLDNPELQMPWYFGWELIGIAILLLPGKHVRLFVELILIVWASRLLASDLNVDVGRRLLEMGIIAYSPAMLFLWRGVRPPAMMTWYFVVVGILQLIMSIRAGVIQF